MKLSNEPIFILAPGLDASKDVSLTPRHGWFETMVQVSAQSRIRMLWLVSAALKDVGLKDQRTDLLTLL